MIGFRPVKPKRFTNTIKPDSSLVYVIQRGESGPIKIGISSNPIKRVNNLQVSSPEELRILAVLPGGKRLERHLHSIFAGHHIRGEWFRAHKDILDYVKNVQRTRQR